LPEFADPYIDPASGLLRNKLGLTDSAALHAAESDLVTARVIELLEHPPRVTGDRRQLQAIHQYAFQDIFDWAGRARTVDIFKNVEGATHFLPASMIERSAGFIAQELASERMLRGLQQDQFVERLAHHYEALNYWHGFRDGNGRTQRFFWGQIAHQAGYDLSWTQVTGEVNNHASRVAMETQDLSELRTMFAAIVAPIAAPGALSPVDALRVSMENAGVPADAIEARLLAQTAAGSHPREGLQPGTRGGGQISKGISRTSGQGHEHTDLGR
jgi:cell filamentation protein